MKLRYSALIGMMFGTSMALSSAAAQEVEVLHWWTSGGEAKALEVLKNDLSNRGVGWIDAPVAGGGGEQAMAVLRSRITGGSPPTAVQMLGLDLQDWAAEGVLADLNSVAAEGKWDKVVPKAIQRFSKFNGTWVAAPVNAHSTNWVWGNRRIFQELKLKRPRNWDELIETLETIKKAGYVGLAHGGQAWQDATLFEGVLLSTGGIDFYRKALVDLDESALNSDTMRKVFSRMRQLRGYVDDNFSGRDWNLATAMVINGKAGMQIMGDWAKGEFLNAGQQPFVDFDCFRVPGSGGAVTFNSDQFAMFAVAEDKRSQQNKLANAVMSPKFQEAFNVVKGSVPARTDVSNTNFDICGKKGMADLAAAASTDHLEGSMAHGHTVPAAIKNAFYDVITAHFNGEITDEEAAEEMLYAVYDNI